LGVALARTALGRSLGVLHLVSIGHGALACIYGFGPAYTSGRMGELRAVFHEHYDVVSRAAVSRIFCLPSSRILSTLRSPIACVSCHLSVQALRGAFASAGVNISDEAWPIAFVDHLAQCGGDASVHTASSWLVTALAEIISETRGSL
jgi:hypothetical protein